VTRLHAAATGHPRHTLLFALATGLLTSQIHTAAVVAATAAALAAAWPPAGRAGAASPALAAGGAGARGGVGSTPVLAVLAAAAVLGGAVWAALRAGAIEDGRLEALIGRELVTEAVLLEPVRERGIGPAVVRARLGGEPAPGAVAVVRMRREAHRGPWPGVGEIVAVEGTVAALGRFDDHQRRRGATGAVDAARLEPTGRRRGGLAGVLDGVRRRAEDGLERGLPGREAALLRGMVLGQDEQLAEEVRDEFRASGLAHLLAVSGQNVMLLAVLALGAGAVAGLRRRPRLLLALGLVVLYVPLTGAGPSVQRAGVMGAAGLVAALAGRPRTRWYALGLAAAGTLALNPLAAGDAGWQLSFAAVAALFALAPRIRDRVARTLPGPVAEVLAITTAATVGTAPLMALHFGQVSLASLPANVLAAVAVAPVMWLGMLATAAAQLSPAAAAPFSACAAPLLAFIEWVAHVAAAAPWAVVQIDLHHPSPGLLAAAAAAVAAVAVVVAQRRSARPHARGRGGLGVGAGLGASGSATRRSAVVVAAAVAALAVGLVTATAARGPGPPGPGDLVVSFLDIGQGDATLIQRDGVAILVDTGPPDGPILERLDEAGVDDLDLLVLTHAQSDHEGAALAVLREHPARLVLNGGAGWRSPVQRGLPAAARAGPAHTRVIAARAGQRLAIGAIRLDVLWPPPAPRGFVPDGDPNERAVVAHVRVGAFDLLLPADAESDITNGLDLTDVEALKVAHHGSADETLPLLLDRIDPEVAAIEVGRENTYGHPAPSTLAALRQVPDVVRTDRDGTVRLHVSHGVMTIERHL